MSDDDRKEEAEKDDDNSKNNVKGRIMTERKRFKRRRLGKKWMRIENRGLECVHLTSCFFLFSLSRERKLLILR